MEKHMPEVPTRNGHIWQTLAQGIARGRLPHAIGLEGPAGSGKTQLALRLAQALVCQAQPARRPCGQCPHCRLALAGSHPDITLLAPAEGKESISVEAVRQLRTSAQLRPNQAEARVFVIQNAQGLTLPAQNALLKILEEPPPAVHFVLTYQGSQALLPTLRSRMTALALQPPMAELPEQAQALAGHLLRGQSYEALVQLTPLEKNREGYLTLLEQTGLVLTSQAVAAYRPQGAGSAPPGQAAELARRLAWAAGCARQNVSLGLLSAAICTAPAGMAQLNTIWEEIPWRK